MKYFKVKMTGACGYQLALKFVYLRNQEYLCILVYLRNQETTWWFYIQRVGSMQERSTKTLQVR